MSPITTHILDLSTGKPASGVSVTLETFADGVWHFLADGKTNFDGRLPDLLPSDTAISSGTYRLTFDTGAYFGESQTKTFYPSVQILFAIDEPTQHYHVPLLLSPFGYSTYRGS